MTGHQSSDFLSIWPMGILIGNQMALRAAIELNVFDIINDAQPEAQLSSVEIVSKIPTTNPNAATALDRILRLLGASSFLSMSLRPCSNGKAKQEWAYGLTRVSRNLVSNNGGASLAPLVVLAFSDKAVVESLYAAKDMVLEQGCMPFNKTHGESFFEYLGKNPQASGVFNQEMACLSKIWFDRVLEGYHGFKDVKVLIDVGGGNGTSLGKIISAHPHIRGINFDLPHVIADAIKCHGVEHVAGDMFESLPNAQAILLKMILHDWDDDHCIKLLKNCWKVLPNGGKVIVVEIVVPQELGNDPESLYATAMDFTMMVILGGKERTKAEFDDLANAAGFTETKIFSIGQGIHVLEFIKGNAT